MSDTPKTPGQEPDQTPEEREPYVPASPVKRTLAWMGVIYMVIIVALTTYNLATGEALHGIPGLLLAPACGGLAAVAFLKFREDRRGAMLFLGLVAAAACVANVALGAAALLRALGG